MARAWSHTTHTREVLARRARIALAQRARTALAQQTRPSRRRSRAQEEPQERGQVQRVREWPAHALIRGSRRESRPRGRESGCAGCEEPARIGRNFPVYVGVGFVDA